jgi:hypothetical protein
MENNKGKEPIMLPYVAFECREERAKEERDEIRAHDYKIIRGLCIAIAVLAVILGMVFGGMIYIISNYEVEVYDQYVEAGDSGEASIEDGIHVNEPDKNE